MKLDYVTGRMTPIQSAPQKAEAKQYVPQNRVGVDFTKLQREVHLRPDQMIKQMMNEPDMHKLLMMARPIPIQDSYARDHLGAKIDVKG